MTPWQRGRRHCIISDPGCAFCCSRVSGLDRAARRFRCHLVGRTERAAGTGACLGTARRRVVGGRSRVAGCRRLVAGCCRLVQGCHTAGLPDSCTLGRRWGVVITE